MSFDTALYMTAVITLFVIMDPPGAIPVFLSLVGRKSKEARNRAAWQAPAVSLAVITVFAIGGQAILDYLHIGIPALQGAGGLLLLLIALELLTGRDANQPKGNEDVNVALVPLGTPLMAGPGAIAAVIVFVNQAEGHRVLRWRWGWRSDDSPHPVRGAAVLHGADPAVWGERHLAAGPDRRTPAGRDRGEAHCGLGPRIHRRWVATCRSTSTRTTPRAAGESRAASGRSAVPSQRALWCWRWLSSARRISAASAGSPGRERCRSARTSWQWCWCCWRSGLPITGGVSRLSSARWACSWSQACCCGPSGGR